MNQKPFLEKYRKGELVQYFNNVLEILTNEKAKALNISEQRETLTKIMKHFNASWQPNKGSTLTPQIQKLDEERDSLFLGLKTTVDIWAAHHYDFEKQNAAFLLADKINAHGDSIQRLRYQQETATLNALLSDLSVELAKETALLGLTEWVTKLQELNTSFNTKYIERAKALSTEEDGVVLQLRTESTKAYRALINIFEARMAIATVEGTDTSIFHTVNNELNELTNQYNEAVKTNKNKAASENSDN